MTSVLRRDTMLSSHLMPFAGDMKFGFTDFDHIGWLLCDGRTLNISDYNQLFQIIGYTYGGTVGTTFKLPDMRGRVPGAINPASNQNTDLSIRNKGVPVGTETHTLTIAEMPRHRHGGTDTANTPVGNDGSGNTGSSTTGITTNAVGGLGQPGILQANGFDTPGSLDNTGSNEFNLRTSAALNITDNGHTHTIGKTGNDQPHNNMQPTLFIGNMFIYCGNFHIGRRRGDYAGQPI